MSLKYEPASEPLHISQPLCLTPNPNAGGGRERGGECGRGGGEASGAPRVGVGRRAERVGGAPPSSTSVSLLLLYYSQA